MCSLRRLLFQRPVQETYLNEYHLTHKQNLELYVVEDHGWIIVRNFTNVQFPTYVRDPFPLAST